MKKGKLLLVFVMGVWGAVLLSCTEKKEAAPSTAGGEKMQYNKLTPEEEDVILHKGTERPGTGEYTTNKAKGTYVCKRCNAALYRSDDKFESHCGWPSFDDEIPGAVKRQLDADGKRTEILCANCGGHLGHVFNGEGMTEKNVRHCVNSISLKFIPAEAKLPDMIKPSAKTQTAYFAGGCFWGTEFYFQQAKGVVRTRVGYMGGHTKNPTYNEVCSHTTGHLEANEVIFDPTKTSYEELAKLFFEIHDPTQADGQGPDIGEQYKSVVFYTDDEQKQTAQKLIDILKSKGFKVATELRPATEFWVAEEYHQGYYHKKGGEPYCHSRVKRF